MDKTANNVLTEEEEQALAAIWDRELTPEEENEITQSYYEENNRAQPKKREQYLEEKLQQYLRDNKTLKITKRGVMTFTGFEIPIRGAMDLLKGEVRTQTGLIARERFKSVCRIDCTFRFYRVSYVCEIKYPVGNEFPNFWDASKVVSYCHYYNWAFKPKNKHHPAIFVPKYSIKLEHKIVANMMKIKLFAIEETENGYTITSIN